jgi:uncharacterized protein
VRFWDSSALVPLLVTEARSASVRPLLERDPQLVIWWGTPVECWSAVSRLRREGGLRPEEAVRAQRVLDRLAKGADQMQPTEPLRAYALRLVATHPLRAADALQLAAALVWCQGLAAGTGFVCLDERLRAAAAIEGFDPLP